LYFGSGLVGGVGAVIVPSLVVSSRRVVAYPQEFAIDVRGASVAAAIIVVLVSRILLTPSKG
jgi:hypothetical protein